MSKNHEKQQHMLKLMMKALVKQGFSIKEIREIIEKWKKQMVLERQQREKKNAELAKEQAEAETEIEEEQEQALQAPDGPGVNLCINCCCPAPQPTQFTATRQVSPFCGMPCKPAIAVADQTGETKETNIGPAEPDLCQEHNNQLEDGVFYDFYQYSYAKHKHTRFYLGMTAVNNKVPQFEDKYHGWSSNPSLFTRASFFIERPAKDKEAADATVLLYNKSLARELGMNGGFLEGHGKAKGMCLSTLKDGNFKSADGSVTTRLQHNRCPTKEDFERHGADFIHRFLWTGDSAIFATDRIVIR